MRQIIESTDALQAAFTKTNANFTELYDAAALNYWCSGVGWRFSHTLSANRVVSQMGLVLDATEDASGAATYDFDLLRVDGNAYIDEDVTLHIGTTAFFYTPPNFESCTVTGGEVITNSITCTNVSMTLQHLLSSGGMNFQGIDLNIQQLDLDSGGCTIGDEVHQTNSLTAANIKWGGGSWDMDYGVQVALGPMQAGAGHIGWVATGTVDSIPMSGGLAELEGTGDAGLTVGYLGTSSAVLSGLVILARVDTTGGVTASDSVAITEARDSSASLLTMSGNASCVTAYGAGIALSDNARITNFYGGAQRADSTVVDSAVVTGTIQLGGSLTWSSDSADGPARIVATGDFSAPTTIDYAGACETTEINAANADITIHTTVAKVTITEGGSLTIVDGGHVDEIDLGNGTLYLINGTVISGTCTAAFSDAGGTTPITPSGITIDATYLYGPIVLGTEKVLPPNAPSAGPTIPNYMTYQPALMDEESAAADPHGITGIRVWKSAA